MAIGGVERNNVSSAKDLFVCVDDYHCSNCNVTGKENKLYVCI